MNRRMRTFTITGLSLLAGAGAGELLSRVFRTPDSGQPAAAARQPAESSGRVNGKGGTAAEDAAIEELRAALQHIPHDKRGITRASHEAAFRIVSHLRSTTDCAKAAALLDDAPAHLRHLLTEAVFRTWARMDPAAALRAADRLKNWQTQRLGVETVLKKWAGGDPAAALREVTLAPPGYVRRRGVQTVLTVAGKDDPVRSVQLLAGLPKPDPGALQQALAAWTARDATAAWQWAGSQTDPARREQATRAVLDGMTESGQREEALALARKEPEGRVRRQMTGSVMNTWIRRDPLKAMTTAGKLPAEEFTPGMVHGMVKSAFNILHGYAAGAPDGSAWVEEQIAAFPPGEHQEAARAALAVQVLTFNFGREFQAEKALPVLAEMPDGPWKARAVADLAELWTHTDAVAASEWLVSLPPSVMRDAAVKKFVERIALSDPERAQQWAETVHGK